MSDTLRWFIYPCIVIVITTLVYLSRARESKKPGATLRSLTLILIPVCVPYLVIGVQTQVGRKKWMTEVVRYRQSVGESSPVYDLKVMVWTPTYARVYIVTECTGIDPTNCPTMDNCRRRRGKTGEEVVFQRMHARWESRGRAGGVVWTDCGSADGYTFPPFLDH